MRIDKLLWCLRLAKTRSLATQLCNSEQVTLNDEVVKASKIVKVGDELSIKSNPIWRTYTIKALPSSRLGAKLVPDYMEEITEEELLQTLENIQKINRENKSLGIKGRPTKKNRRDMDRFRKL